LAVRDIRYLDPLVVSKLNHIELKARLIVEGFLTGLHRSPYHGFSVEFAEHRPYPPGESLRNIDWKVLGKTDKLYVKKFEEETNLRAWLLLDISDSMRYPVGGPMTKLEYGAYIAAALGYLMVRQRDAVGAAFFDDRIDTFLPPKAKASWLVPMFARLEELTQTASQFTRRTATAEVLHNLARKLHRRGIVVLITDLLSSEPPQKLFNALQHLRHQGHEILLFHLLDHATEAHLDLPNRPTILQDLETGEELRIQPEQIRAAYREKMGARLQALRTGSRRYNVDLMEVDIRMPFDKVLQRYLARRQALTR